MLKRPFNVRPMSGSVPGVSGFGESLLIIRVPWMLAAWFLRQSRQALIQAQFSGRAHPKGVRNPPRRGNLDPGLRGIAREGNFWLPRIALDGLPGLPFLS